MTQPKPERWAVWSTRAEGVLPTPREIGRLPAKAEKSGDGRWATVYGIVDGHSVPVAVFILLPSTHGYKRPRKT